jgi:thioredoxin-related protein
MFGNMCMIFDKNTNKFCNLIYRETKTNGRTERIAIETDQQLALELPEIVYGRDRLQSE